MVSQGSSHPDLAPADNDVTPSGSLPSGAADSRLPGRTEGYRRSSNPPVLSMPPPVLSYSSPLTSPDQRAPRVGDDPHRRSPNTSYYHTLPSVRSLHGSPRETGRIARNRKSKDGLHRNLLLPPEHALATTAPSPALLHISEKVLGYGAQGTVVQEGFFQRRPVAVKRVVKNFAAIVEKEIKALEASNHPNVIRYFYREETQHFYHIALELCPANLADIIERPADFPKILATFQHKRALRQITTGLRHIHALRIIHRDIKPQNILVSPDIEGADSNVSHRMLISDFGICKKLGDDETSYEPSSAASGTVGWRAPEVLRGDVKIAETVGVASGEAVPPGRLRKSVDIFPLGCLFYYVLTDGLHPFGNRVRREGNILDDVKSLQSLEQLDEGMEAMDLISAMLDPTASARPDTLSCLLHPYFWGPERRLNFLQDASDWFEPLRRLPHGDPQLVELEKGAANVVRNDWKAALDPDFVANLGAQRRYDGSSTGDLMRVIRNKKHHYYELPDSVKALLGSLPEDYLGYFTRRFPGLIMHVYGTVLTLSLTEEDIFWPYYHMTD